MSEFKLSLADKTRLRKILLDNGIRPRGLSDQEISDKAAELQNSKSADSDQRDYDAKKAKRKRKSTRFDVPEDLVSQPKAGPAIDDVINVNPKPEAKPKSPGLAGALETYIDERLADAGPAVDEAQIIALIEKHGNATTRLQHDYKIQQSENAALNIDGAHPLLGKSLDVVTSNENLFLVGPAGCGKTSLVIQMAQALNVDFHFTGSVADKFEMTGFVDANGTYHETSFYKACKHGGMFLFDEVDGSIPSAAIFFNAALENGYVNFPNGEMIIIDRATTFFAAAGNTIGKGPDRQYVGRYPMDAAFLNRFQRLFMDYDISIELAMAEAAWLSVGGAKDQVSIALNFAHEVIAFRKKLEDRKIICLISPRDTRRACKWLAKGWSLSDVRETLYVELSDDLRASLEVQRHA